MGAVGSHGVLLSAPQNLTFGVKRLSKIFDPSGGLEGYFRNCPFEFVTGRNHSAICEECLYTRCKDLRAIGLNEEGNPLPPARRGRCGAKNRKGSDCKLPVLPGKRRCRFH